LKTFFEKIYLKIYFFIPLEFVSGGNPEKIKKRVG
jgi:hypothetical protein